MTPETMKVRGGAHALVGRDVITLTGLSTLSGCFHFRFESVLLVRLVGQFLWVGPKKVTLKSNQCHVRVSPKRKHNVYMVSILSKIKLMK